MSIAIDGTFWEVVGKHQQLPATCPEMNIINIPKLDSLEICAISDKYLVIEKYFCKVHMNLDWEWFSGLDIFR